VTAAVMIAHRRWRSQQAGLTGDFGSVVMPTTAHRDTERAILRNVVGHLKVYG
jgi:ribosomal protein S28E/S33